MRALPGGTVIWVIGVAELVTFALFFLVYAAYAAADPQVFSDSQALVHPLSGAVNTAVLLTASWGAARAVGHDWRWWLIPSAAGALFLAIKTHEYADVFALGVSLSTNLYWFFYLFLTLLHALHVVAGILISGVMAFNHRLGDDYRGEPDEAAALYWHIVDLIWIALFPLLYLIPVGVR